MKTMMNWVSFGSVLLASAFMISGCSQEESTLAPPTFSANRPLTSSYFFTAELNRNSAEYPESRLILVGYAADEDPRVPQAPFPVLYLLHDYLGDAGYFERYSLQALLDEMYKNGEIGRMLVVTVDASNYFGGSYYRNSATTGNYQDVVDATIAYVETAYRTHSRANGNARAISGHGMGGYGAMRYALDHPDLFGSVSSLSGPLSFGDPAAGTGIWNSENGMISTSFAQNGTGPGDPSLYGRLRDGANLHYETGNLFAMASAFSAHPLRVYDSTGNLPVPKFPYNGQYDTVYNHDFFSGRPAGANTVSFESQVDTFGVGVDLPFDSLGNPTESVWARWRDTADVKTAFLKKRQEVPTLWNNMEIYIDVGVDNEHGYLEQNRDFHNALTAAGVEHTYEEYIGSGVLPAGHSDLLLSRLREVLKFHSDRFERPDGPTPQ